MGVKITPEDLNYEYSKTVTNGDKPQFRGKPDSVLFNREEEYEVIPMLKMVMDHFNTESWVALHKLENMIKDDLPGDIRKRGDVFDWLIQHFEQQNIRTNFMIDMESQIDDLISTRDENILNAIFARARKHLFYHRGDVVFYRNVNGCKAVDQVVRKVEDLETIRQKLIRLLHR